MNIHDLAADAELVMLGGLLLYPQKFDDAARVVHSGDFLVSRHAELWSVIDGLHAEGVSPTPEAVGDRIKHGGGDPAVVFDAVAAGQADVGTQAEHVARYSSARRLIAACSHAAQQARELVDPDDVLDALAADLGSVPRRRGDELPGLYSFDELRDRPVEESAPWVIEGLLREGWRAVLVAAEGAGKMTLLRQIALQAAQGVHPFTLKPIDRVPALVVDLENPLDSIQNESARVTDRLRSEVGDLYRDHEAWLWHQPAGVNLRSRPDRARLEAALELVQPRIVVLGPLYKAFRRGKGETDEDAAGEVASVLDGLRDRFGFALLVEHHAPKGSMAGRDMVPFGSSLWLRWPEFGLTLETTEHDKRFRVGRFRRDRVHGLWPEFVEWGARFPFIATMPRR